MEIKVKRVTDWSLVLDAARWTMNKDELAGKEPSDGFKRKILLAEHSPIRMLEYVIEMLDIPSWVSQHLARHDAFAGHTVREGMSDVHYVGTQRGD